MPPVNTPAVASPSARSPDPLPSPMLQNRPLTPLSYLSSPVPDLAATLHTQAADEADQANVSFLRDSLDSLEQLNQQHQQQQQQQQAGRGTHIDPQRDPRRTNQPQPAQQSQESPEDLSRRERLQRVLSRLNRLHEPVASSTTSAYSNRTPSPNRQTIYDWAPSYDDNNQDDNELDAILNELRRQQPSSHTNTDLPGAAAAAPAHSRLREGNGTPAPISGADTAERRDRLRERERRRRETEWVNLRTRAALQRSRQEGSPSATDRMLRYVMERERSGLSEEEERARGSGWFRPSPARVVGNEEHRNTALSRESWLLPPPAGSEARERERQERVEAFRRGYLAENVPPPPRLPRISTPPAPPNASTAAASSVSPFLENALKYLSDLRSCSRYEEALSVAIDHGLATKEFFADKHDDFVMDLEALPGLPYSSWLQPGTVFDGHQHATNGSATLTHTSRASAITHSVEQINPNFGSTRRITDGIISVPAPQSFVFDASRPWLSHQFTPPPSFGANVSKHATPAEHDHWPVRVTLHSIDPERMTVQGTMEAYDVPQHASSAHLLSAAGGAAVGGLQHPPKAGKKHAPITTYLEGHIVDMKRHSFLTPSPLTTKSGTPRDSEDSETIPFPSATPATDAQNWMHLPPFSTLSASGSSTTPADQVARLLLSTAELEKLNEEYIFMRWKERCFIHSLVNDPCPESERERRGGDQDRGHGLTISGFYYVSLHRESGRCEGIYFDPSSTPFQVLRLQGVRGGWPGWEFR